MRTFLPRVLIVQWIEYLRPKEQIYVRIVVGTPIISYLFRRPDGQSPSLGLETYNRRVRFC